MKRIVGPLVAGLLVLGLAPVALAQDGASDLGHILLSVNGPVDVTEGEQTELVVAVSGDAGIEGTATWTIVVNGDATVSGTAEAVVVVNGDAVLTGATVSGVVVVNGTASIGPGTVVSGDVVKPLPVMVTARFPPIPPCDGSTLSTVGALL